MDIESAKQLSYENMRKMYKIHLESQGLGKNTVQTFSFIFRKIASKRAYFLAY